MPENHSVPGEANIHIQSAIGPKYELASPARPGEVEPKKLGTVGDRDTHGDGPKDGDGLLAHADPGGRLPGEREGAKRRDGDESIRRDDPCRCPPPDGDGESPRQGCRDSLRTWPGSTIPVCPEYPRGPGNGFETSPIDGVGSAALAEPLPGAGGFPPGARSATWAEESSPQSPQQTGGIVPHKPAAKPRKPKAPRTKSGAPRKRSLASKAVRPADWPVVPESAALVLEATHFRFVWWEDLPAVNRRDRRGELRAFRVEYERLPPVDLDMLTLVYQKGRWGDWDKVWAGDFPPEAYPRLGNAVILDYRDIAELIRPGSGFRTMPQNLRNAIRQRVRRFNQDVPLLTGTKSRWLKRVGGHECGWWFTGLMFTAASFQGFPRRRDDSPSR